MKKGRPEIESLRMPLDFLCEPMDIKAKVELEVRELLWEMCAIKHEKIKLTDDLCNDLGIAGDDLSEFLEEFARRCNVNRERLLTKCGDALNEGGGISLIALLRLCRLVDDDPTITVGELIEMAVEDLQRGVGR